MSDNKPTEEWV